MPRPLRPSDGATPEVPSGGLGAPAARPDPEAGDAADRWLAQAEAERQHPDGPAADPFAGLDDLDELPELDDADVAPVPAGWVEQPGGAADAEIAAYVARAQASALEAMPALSAFQRRMDGYPQLSDTAVAELVADYQAGRAARAEVAAGTRKAGDARRAQEAIRRAERAKEHLAGSMFRLVLLIAREQAEERYGRDRSLDLLPDLVGEAHVALTEAMDTFDPNRVNGPSFSIYAGRMVRDRVRMVLTKDTPIRLAPSWTRLKRIAAVRVPQLHVELGRAPSREEVQAALLTKCMEWAEEKLTPAQRMLDETTRRDLCLAKLRKQGMLGAIDRLDEVLIATQSVASLDSPVGEDGSSSLGDMLAARGQEDMLAGVEHAELARDITAALETLSDRERTIVLHRFGFVDGELWTYSRIADMFGVTAERIRQIEKNVLARLGSPHGSYTRLAAHLPSQFDAPAPAPEPARRGRARE